MVSATGEVLQGRHSAHSEYPIHTEVMRARSDVGAVVHTHPRHALALGATQQELRPVSNVASMFVPPTIPRLRAGVGLITSPELGAETAAALGNHDVLFLENHGIVSTGHDVPTAAVRAVLLDRACADQLRIAAVGAEPVNLSAADAQAKAYELQAFSVQPVWDYLVRGLGGCNW